MTQEQYIIGRKLNIVELAEQLGNISDACRKLGVSRRHYYDIKQALEEEGLEGLLNKARNTPRTGNRVAPEIEQRILDLALEVPVWGQVRVANELKKAGMEISAGGVRSVWLRHELHTRSLRLSRLEQWAAEEKHILTENQIRSLEKAKDEKQEHGEIETHHPGFLLGQDTVYVGTLKGVGRIYQQTGIDTYSNVGFAKLYSDKTGLTSADFLNDQVLPFFDGQGIQLQRVLTDRGTEYCGVRENHPFELFLYLNGIDHSRTKARHPQTNGITERLNQTINDEFYQVYLRKKIYTTLEELQKDLDEFIEYYNTKRTNQGRYCRGRTPMQTFTEALPLYYKYMYDNRVEEFSDVA